MKTGESHPNSNRYIWFSLQNWFTSTSNRNYLRYFEYSMQLSVVEKEMINVDDIPIYSDHFKQRTEVIKAHYKDLGSLKITSSIVNLFDSYVTNAGFSYKKD